MYIRLTTTAATTNRTTIITVPITVTATRPLPSHPFFPQSSSVCFPLGAAFASSIFPVVLCSVAVGAVVPTDDVVGIEVPDVVWV